MSAGHGRLFLAALAATVVAVLLQGASRRQHDAAGAAPVEPATSPLPLRADLEKTPLSYFSDYWLQLGRRVKPRLLPVGPANTPALVVGPDLAVSTIDAAVGSPVDPAAMPSRTRLLVADAATGLALFAIGPPAPPEAFRPADAASLHPGKLVAAVTVLERDRLEVVPGHILSTGDAPAPADAAGDPLDAFLPLGSSTRAAAVVDLDGNLVGAALRADGRVRLLSARSLMAAVERLRSRRSCRGLEVGDLDEGVRHLLGLDGGVAVWRVHAGCFGSKPSLEAGDVLLEWGGRTVASAGEFGRLHDADAPGTSVHYVARRGRRMVRGRLVIPGPDCRPPGEAPVPLPRSGLTLAWDSGADEPPAWRVTAVRPGGPGEQTGIRPRDRILGTDGSRPDRGEVLRALTAFEKRGQATVLTVERAGRVALVALPHDGR